MAELTVVDRKSGEARSFHINAVDRQTILSLVRANIAKEPRLSPQVRNRK